MLLHRLACAVLLPALAARAGTTPDSPAAGTAGGLSRGGWPGGMENAQVRFIRLQYEGGDWDRNMGPDGDYQFLRQFGQLTALPIATQTEAVPVSALRRFPKHRAPPFVYLTGSGDLRLDDADVKTLRWYCLEESGLLFADGGGPRFDKALRALAARCFPEVQWEEIANDDVLFQQPFLFPNGAPPLWHHAGNRAQGLRRDGRWLLFYHPGDLGDAWNTGHSGASEALAAQAYKLGVNVIHYAFCQYMQRHFPGLPVTSARPVRETSPPPGITAVAAPGNAPARTSQIERVLSEVSHERPAGPTVGLDADLAKPPQDNTPAAGGRPPAGRTAAAAGPDTPLSREPGLEPE